MRHFAAKVSAPHDYSNMLRIHAGPWNPPVQQSLKSCSTKLLEININILLSLGVWKLSQMVVRGGLSCDRSQLIFPGPQSVFLQYFGILDRSIFDALRYFSNLNFMWREKKKRKRQSFLRLNVFTQFYRKWALWRNMKKKIQEIRIENTKRSHITDYTALSLPNFPLQRAYLGL